MAVPRSIEFPGDLRALADAARALAHPARLAILKDLASRGVCVCGELVDALPLAQSTVSQHLKVLRSSGLIQGTVDGPRSCYCVDVERLRAVKEAFDAWFGSVTAGPECC